MSRLALSEVVDFSRLAFPNAADNLYIKRFTVSACGKFLLVVVGTDIFVYVVNPSDAPLKPCVRLVANREVLKVSMDTRSDRFAVAALLSGRTGMCWEIQDIFDPARPQPSSIIPVSIPERQAEWNLTQIEHVDHNSADYILDIQSESPEPFQDPVVHESKRWWMASALPIRTKPTNHYSNLGCPSDSPRSVAICPQRKCVAFGCRAGIELHWVDALTSTVLSRWFPLAAPSDFLYFLPQRLGVDTTRKLRLISSAADLPRRKISRHNSAPSKWRYTPFSSQHGRQRSMTRLFFGNLPFPTTSTIEQSQPATNVDEEAQGVLRTVDCDHYCAIPLSDGFHILFTDPDTGLLCLGSDAPLGGPTKLIRKVCMIPPPETSSIVNCYAVGQNLDWGVRVVAAYDDGTIVLYNLPSGSFEKIRHCKMPDVWDEFVGVLGQSDLLMDDLMAGSQASTDHPTGIDTPVGSFTIEGAYICRVEDVVDDLLVESSNGGLRLWVFHSGGQAVKMDIYVPRDHEVRSYVVGVDGILRHDDSLPCITNTERLSDGIVEDDLQVEGNSSIRLTFDYTD